MSKGSGQRGHHIEDIQHYHQTKMSILDESAKPQIMFSDDVFVHPCLNSHFLQYLRMANMVWLRSGKD